MKTHAKLSFKFYSMTVVLWLRLVGCFGFNGPLRQYFSLYLGCLPENMRKKIDIIDERKKTHNKLPVLDLQVPCLPSCLYLAIGPGFLSPKVRQNSVLQLRGDRDNLWIISHISPYKTYFVTHHNVGLQHMLSLRNNKNYLLIILNTLSYLELCQICTSWAAASGSTLFVPLSLIQCSR